MNEEQRAAFAQSFQDRRKMPVDDPAIFAAIERYHFDCYISSLVHGEGSVLEGGGEVIEWLRDIQETSAKLLDLLDPRRILGHEQPHARNMFFQTFAAGLTVSPFHEMQQARDEKDGWNDLIMHGPLPFLFGAGIGHPFLQILADLSEHPAYPDLSWNYFHSRQPEEIDKIARAKEELGGGETIEALGGLIRVKRTDKTISLKEAGIRAGQLLCARLYNAFSRKGKKTGTYDDLIGLLGYHNIPMQGITTRKRGGDQKAVISRLKMHVSKGREFLEGEEKKQSRFYGWEALFYHRIEHGENIIKKDT